MSVKKLKDDFVNQKKLNGLSLALKKTQLKEVKSFVYKSDSCVFACLW